MCLPTLGYKSQPDNARPARRVLMAVTLAASLLIAIRPPAQADNFDDKSDRFLTRTMAAQPAKGWSSVIIRLNADLTAARETELKGLGADIYRHFPFIHSVAARVPNRHLARVAALPFVSHLSADVAVKKNDEFIVGSSGAGAAYQQYNLTGYGVTVAVVDSGINVYHQDLTDSITGGYRTLASVSFATDTTKTSDDCGHGTHVAGIIAGNGACSTGSNYFRTFYGIARRTNLVNVRVLDQYGQGTVSTVLAGIQWVVNNKAQYNIRVMNLSLGHPVGDHYANDPLCQAVEQAWKAGIVVVCAAGNQGRLNATQTAGMDNEGWGTAYGSIQSPGNDPYVITVGATKSMDGVRAHDRIATYSSRGPSRLDFVMKPDIVAPGNRIISLDVNNCYLDTAYGSTNQIPMSAYSTTNGNSYSAKYFRLSGTSMASPVVAGAAALLLEKDPTLSPDTIKARLMISADKWAFPTGQMDPCTFGAGYLNIPAALACTGVATQSAVSPSLYRDALGNVCVNTQQILWGNTIIWGVSGVNNLQVIWGNTIIWGTATLTNSTIIWGTNVWSNTIIWGTSTSAVDLTSTAINGEQ